MVSYPTNNLITKYAIIYHMLLMHQKPLTSVAINCRQYAIKTDVTAEVCWRSLLRPYLKHLRQ